jgi:hypothetical protein
MSTFKLLYRTGLRAGGRPRNGGNQPVIDSFDSSRGDLRSKNILYVCMYDTSSFTPPSTLHHDSLQILRSLPIPTHSISPLLSAGNRQLNNSRHSRCSSSYHLIATVPICVLLQDERSSGSSSFASFLNALLILLRHRRRSRKVVLFAVDVLLHQVNVGRHNPLHLHLLVPWRLVGKLADFTFGMRRRPCFTNGALI